jgi:DNA primase
MSTIDEIKARLDIVELVRGYVQLKKAGRNFKGLCPFHSEKTPSFIIFPDTQTWRCFGCGQGGDIFTFTEKIENLIFSDALRMLAQKAGVELEPYTPQEVDDQEKHQRLRRLLSDAATLFYNQLLDAPHAAHARDYIVGRGFSWETIETFQLGYAPESWDATMQELMARGYEQQDLEDTGMLVVREDTGSVYDRFRNRLMIPIRDARGQVVGFGARTLNPNDIPKYLNTPQTALFDKSRLLFGLSHVRRPIRDTETAVIVEGYMDVMQAYQAGFTNVVAQMGTALTEPQLRLLSRYARRLILALDPDTAGQLATERGREIVMRVSEEAADAAKADAIGKGTLDEVAEDHHAVISHEFDPYGMLRHEARLGFELHVIVLPEGKDPDALIRESPEAWEELVQNALPIVEHAIQTAIVGQDLDDPKAKVHIADRVVPLIDSVANAVERSHYRQRLARLLQVDERALFAAPITRGPRRSTKRQMASAPEPTAPAAPVRSSALPGGTYMLEAFCLAALIRNPNLLYIANRALAEALDGDDYDLESSFLARRLTVEDFTHPENRSLYQAWLAALAQDEYEPYDYLTDVLDAVLSEHLATVMCAYETDSPLEAGRALMIALGRIMDLRVYRLKEYEREVILWLEDADLTTDEQRATIKAHIVGRHALQRARARLGTKDGRSDMVGTAGDEVALS